MFHDAMSRRLRWRLSSAENLLQLLVAPRGVPAASGGAAPIGAMEESGERKVVIREVLEANSSRKRRRDDAVPAEGSSAVVMVGVPSSPPPVAVVMDVGILRRDAQEAPDWPRGIERSEGRPRDRRREEILSGRTARPPVARGAGGSRRSHSQPPTREQGSSGPEPSRQVTLGEGSSRLRSGREGRRSERPHEEQLCAYE